MTRAGKLSLKMRKSYAKAWHELRAKMRIHARAYLEIEEIVGREHIEFVINEIEKEFPE